MSKSKHIVDAITPDSIDFSDVDEAREAFDYEKASELEVKKLLKRKQQKQMHDMVDPLYYAVVVFGNQADKNKWLESLNGVEVLGERWIDGYQLAKSMGKEIEVSATLPTPHYVKQLKIKKK